MHSGIFLRFALWLLAPKALYELTNGEACSRAAPQGNCFDPAAHTHSLAHGAEPFFRSRQLCSHSTTSQHFMEPEGSLPRSQDHSTDPYPDPD
jgi:hypothetical protein